MMKRSRRTIASTAGLALGTMLVAGLPATALTNASWTDDEWVSGTQGGDEPGIGTLDCTAEGNFSTRGAGTFLSANVLGLPLSALADVSGVVATNDGTDSSVTPATTPEVGAAGSNAYANPLNLSVLNGVISADLTGLLHIPLGANVGVLNEYAEAQSDGYSAGASGLVNDSGAVDTSDFPTPAEIPDSASLNLSSVVGQILGTAGAAFVSEITRLDLVVGAVAGSAQFDACDHLWTGDLATSLVRDYLVAGLDLDVESDLVGDLVTEVNDTVTDLQAILNALTGPALLGSLTTEVGDLLDGLLGALTLGSFTSTLTANYDFSTLNALLTDTYSDTDDVVEIDFDDEVIRIDIASLLYGPSGLNGLAPNTELLVNSTVINNLTDAVTAALGQFVAAVTAEIDSILDAVEISGTVGFSISADIGLGAVDVIQVGVALSGVTLAELLGNSADPADVSLTFNVLGVVSCPPGTFDLLSQLVCPLVTGIEDAVTTGLLPTVGSAILALLAVPTSELDGTLATLTGELTSPIVEMLDFLLSGLLGVNGLASVLINVQNDPLTGGPEPGDWAGIASGQYDVAALRLGVLGLLGTNGDLDIVLAKGSVGLNTYLP